LFACFLQNLGRTICLQGFVWTTCLARVPEKLPHHSGEADQPLQSSFFAHFFLFLCRMIHCLMHWLTSMCLCACAPVYDAILSQKCDIFRSFRSIGIVTKYVALSQRPYSVLATRCCCVFLSSFLLSFLNFFFLLSYLHYFPFLLSFLSLS